MPQLQDLPPELIVIICKNLESVSELSAFSATNRYFYSIANVEMYILDALNERAFGPSALHWAAYKNDLAMARKALDAGAKPDQYWFSHHPRVHVDSIIALAEHGWRRDLDLEGQYYWTAMHLAVARGNQEMVQLLLHHRASVNVFSSGFCSCIDPTVHMHDFSLSERGNRPSEEPWALLHTAFCFGRDDIAELLATRGAIMYSCRSIFPFRHDIKDARLHNVVPSAKLTLDMAAFYGCPKALKYLLSQSLDINLLDRTRRTVLIHALFGEAPETVVPILILAGAANVNSETVTGRKVLFETCWEGRYAGALQLLDHGADIKCDSVDPAITLLAACCRRATHLVLTSDISPYYPGPVSFLRTLHHDPLKPPTSWPKCQVDKNTKARHKIVQALLARGVDIEARIGLYGSPTVLYLAAECHLHDIVELLISHGANILARNAFGNTALMAAIASGFGEDPLETVKCLLKYDAGVNLQNSIGDTAMHLLHRSRFPTAEIAYRLLLNGANMRIVNQEGELPDGELPDPSTDAWFEWETETM